MLNQLVQLCQQRKPEAERELFSQFAPKVWTICRRYAACDPDAQDYLQECFLCVFDNIRKYDPKKGAFEPWLYRLCTNTILQILRKAKSQLNIVLLEELPEGEEVEDNLVEQIPTETVIAAIQQLPAGYRQVLNLYVFEEWTHREIALELNISESSSRSQLARARKLLKSVLKKLKPNSYERRSA
ncbi:MAG: sigma-70 family RNA polymerase sigma factor [Bacteroidota bacterium]